MNYSMPQTRSAPTKPLIVSEPGKLDYFARAAYVRAGAINTYGALSGFGESQPPLVQADANTQQPGTARTIGSIFTSIGNALFNGNSQTPPPVTTPLVQSESPVPMILGVAAVGIAGIALWKLSKK